MNRVAPCLLVSSPLLLDPNFLHTVVLLIEHNENGAMGVVLNRPIPIPVGQVCSEGGMEYNGDPDAVAYCGGPVEPARGMVLVRGGMPGPDDTVLDFTDFISPRKDLLEDLAKSHGAKFRLFLGYSGWAPGQLEGELERHAWARLGLQPDLLFLDEPVGLWRETMKAFLE
jgi:putative transcriptional regulator